MFESFKLEHKFSYGQLHELLRSQGFADERVVMDDLRECHVFHRPNDTPLFAFAIHEANEQVLPHDVASVRRSLDSSGLMDVADFDAWMAKAGRESAFANAR